jgi:hypothetical protein
MEYQSDYFAGELRGHLLIGQWGGAIYDVALTANGQGASSTQPLLTDGGLDLTEGPGGTIVIAQNQKWNVIYYTPKELAVDTLQVKSLFPRRGHKSGGTVLNIYGNNLNISSFGTVPEVTVGGKDCPLSGPITGKKLSCTLPSGQGTVDVAVSATTQDGSQSDIFRGGYRYIPGPPV